MKEVPVARQYRGPRDRDALRSGRGCVDQEADAVQIPYMILMSDVAEALRLHDLDLKVVVGGLDDPETYRLLRTESAARVKVIAQGCAYNHMNQFRSDGTTS